jgi:hypothetical protein
VGRRQTARARSSHLARRRPGALSALPSHTMALPSGSSQWYASWIPSLPRERQGAAPAFSSTTLARVVTPARCAGSSYACHRTASGPAGIGCSPTRSIAGVL